MHLTVLVSLLTVTVCGQTISQTKPSPATASFSHFSSSLVTSATNITLQTENVTMQIRTDVVSTLPPTPRVEEASLSNTTLNATTLSTTNQTSRGNVSQEQTVQPTSESPNVTATTTGNMTSSGLSAKLGKDDLTSNPGLVAIICIFCIVLTLLLVVVTVKCIRSPRSNFERLEDMPMGKVNEESPFAHYSK